MADQGNRSTDTSLMVRWPDLHLPIVWEKRRRRSFNLQVVSGPKLRVLSPLQAAEEEVLALATKNEQWIRDAILAFEQQSAAKPEFADGGILRLLGQPWSLTVSDGYDLRIRSFRDEQRLQVMTPNPEPDWIQEAVEHWYRHEAKRYLPRRTKECAQHVGEVLGIRLPSVQVNITSAKTRWGSCSRRGKSDVRINYSWRLMIMPEEIVEYVIVHELCHIQEMNHSEKFWSLVERVIPDYKDRRTWLQSEGSKQTW